MVATPAPILQKLHLARRFARSGLRYSRTRLAANAYMMVVVYVVNVAIAKLVRGGHGCNEISFATCS